MNAQPTSGGIFEALNNPITQGLLAGGLGAMASRGSTMQAIGRGGLLGLSAMGQAQASQENRVMQQAKLQLTQDKANREQQQFEQKQKAIKSLVPDANGAINATPAALMAAELGPEHWAAVLNFGRNKVKEYQDVRGPDGSVQRVGFTEYGDTVNTGATPFSEFKTVDFGGNLAAFDPMTGNVYDLGQKTATFGDMNSARNANVAERRLQWDMSKPDDTAKAPAGYRWAASGGLEPIPGGPADEKATMAGEKAEQRRQAAVMQADRMIGSADTALKQMDRWMTTGVSGAVMSNLPGSDANDLRATLETIKANLGFAELQAMREASPTGGALGSVAVQELSALQSTVANLSPNQSEAQLRANLQKIKEHYANMREVLQGKMPKGYDQGGQSWGSLAQEYEKQGMPREVIRQVLQSQGQNPAAWGY